MKNAIEAIFENGAFRPLQPDTVALSNGQVVRLTIENEPNPEQVKLAARVYEGLSDSDINDIERIALDRGNFLATRSTE
ncbi:MAG: antitoxin family protein [Thermoguttaceae bacterium]|jgi:predicted DNA-binding antitoxin AbrB/MazE fold protein